MKYVNLFLALFCVACSRGEVTTKSPEIYYVPMGAPDFQVEHAKLPIFSSKSFSGEDVYLQTVSLNLVRGTAVFTGAKFPSTDSYETCYLDKVLPASTMTRLKASIQLLKLCRIVVPEGANETRKVVSLTSSSYQPSPAREVNFIEGSGYHFILQDVHYSSAGSFTSACSDSELLAISQIAGSALDGSEKIDCF